MTKEREIHQSCMEGKLFNGEIILEHHSLIKIISGEIKMVEVDRISIFGEGDILLLPRNHMATYIKYPKNGLPFKSVTMTLFSEKLQNFYSKKIVQNIEPQPSKIRPLKKDPLLESFFASLIPYFDLAYNLPENLVDIKTEEAITILRAIDPNIDNLLFDFSERGKINLTEFMEKNYMFNMSMAKFGYLTGRSLTTFKRDFKKAFNTTPQKWLTQKRLELAYYQLAEKKRKPIDVYLEVGFENLSHFSFAFKKYFGYAPTKILNIK